MKHAFILLVILFGTLTHASAQDTQASGDTPTTLQAWADRLSKFGQSLPQEEIFIHTDNTSYFLGDTIFYQAYVVRSDGRPSNISGLLYVELLNHDGYLVERQKVKLEAGMGSGTIALLDTLYGGYYELRAYTRWQLNWGQYEHEHTKISEQWFYDKRMAKEYYRDYDKLYSRVFPVFDKPKEAGDYTEDMTLRPLRRYFKSDGTKEEASVTLYPEGGHLIVGVPCRVAFDVCDEDGLHLDGTLSIEDKNGNVVATAKTENRGRGSFTFTPTDETYRYTFSDQKRSGKGKLPKAETDGCAIQVSTEADGIHISLMGSGTAASEPLGLTAMCHGIVADFQSLAAGSSHTAIIPLDKLQTGVVQISVFNDAGRIYADRLVFVRKDDFRPANVTFSGIKTDNSYQPFTPITMGVHGIPGASVSLSVRDAAHSEYIYDSGNILTEMLLCSQLKGFVEAPEYYFEADDDTHRRALDLLLMVQGWRRYNWVEMATPKAFTLNYMPEKTEIMMGQVLRYTAEEQEDFITSYARAGLDEAGMSADYDEFANSQYSSYASREMVHKWNSAKAAMAVAKILQDELHVDAGDYDNQKQDPRDNYIEMRLLQNQAQDADQRREQATKASMTGDVAASRFNENEGNLKREVLVHAEFVQPGVNGQKGDAVMGDMETYDKGAFQITAPGFYDHIYFFLGASDTTKWKAGRQHVWIHNAEDDRQRIEYPEYYVRLKSIYPRFVKPYNVYQTQMRELPKDSPISPMEAGVRKLNEVTVMARRNGLSKFNPNKPAFVIDAYEAFNNVCDAGFCPGYYIGAGRFISDVARTYIGDMNMERPYDLESRFESKNLSFNFSPGVLAEYNHLTNLDKVYIYTDYSPRREGDKKFSQSNQPIVTVDLRRYEDGSRRVTYRDRRYVLAGYSVCEDFYHPDYSTRPLPSTKDYRRTLYWNPALKLDDKGDATVTFYNNSKQTIMHVSAEGMGTNGELLTGQQ